MNEQEKEKHPIGKIIEEKEFKEGKIVEPKEEPKEETVTITRKAFDEFVETVKDMKEEQKLLFQIADKRQLYRVKQRESRDLPKEVSVRGYNGKVVIGWESVENKLEKNTMGVMTERQTTKLFYEDGTNEIVRMRDFDVDFTKIKCKRIEIINDEVSGGKIFKLVRLDGGGELKIADTFVN